MQEGYLRVDHFENQFPWSMSFATAFPFRREAGYPWHARGIDPRTAPKLEMGQGNVMLYEHD
jgi:hypothetical protein